MSNMLSRLQKVLADFLRRTGMTSFVEKRDDGCVVNGILITERE
jgi:hypothetical protein